MLDMFSNHDFSAVDPAADLLSSCRYFDTRYKFRPMPRPPWDRSWWRLEVVGGPRARLFSSLDRELNTTWLDYLVRGRLGTALKLTPPSLHKRVVEVWPSHIPALYKAPITRGPGQYLDSHNYNYAKLASHSCVLLHFKFTADFRSKIDVEVARGEHYRGGAEYTLYRKHLQRHGNLNLYDPAVCAEFSSVESLEQHGLIRDISNFRSDVQS